MNEARAAWKVGILLFAALVVVYNADWTAMDEGDAVPNTTLPLALLHQGTFSFTPEDYPAMFAWQSREPLWVSDEFYVRSWDTELGDKTARQWKDAGYLSLHGPRYHLVRSPTRGVYVSTFGPIPGLTFLPWVAVVDKIDAAYGSKFELGLTVAKLHASVLTALSAALLYWTALAFTTRRRAVLVALAFGVGTCAWAIASQNLWQQTVSIFFLCLGIAPFVRKPESAVASAISGAMFGVAVACRPTSLVLVLAVLGYRALRYEKSKANLVFAITLLPALVAIGAYNYRFFGSPLTFAQSVIGHQMAMAKTGSAALWQTPIWTGLSGLLVSPSRGLLIFSPVLVFGFLGVFRAWKDPKFAPLRPLSIGMGWMMFMQCLWFDWWGGWTYGYRPWLDAMPILALSIVAAIDEIVTVRHLRVAFAVTLAWSAFVQFIGAFTYDKSWNDRQVFVVRLPHVTKPFGLLSEASAKDFAAKNQGHYLGGSYCNIDFTYCRHRLWSFSDSMVLYYITHFSETRRARFRLAWTDLSSHGR